MDNELIVEQLIPEGKSGRIQRIKNKLWQLRQSSSWSTDDFIEEDKNKQIKTVCYLNYQIIQVAYLNYN